VSAHPARPARQAVAAIFLLNGLLFGAWATRIPAVRDRLDLSDGELGLALACLAAGSLISMPPAGALATRRGSRPATRTAFALFCLAAGTVALAPSLPALCALTFAYGATTGALDVTMNAHGVAVERRYARPVLSGFHAAFSLGGLLGAALGALAAAAGVDVRVQLGALAIAAAIVGLGWSRRFLPAGEDAGAAGEPLLVRPPRKLWALGALAFACLLIEGASADWSGVYLKDDLGASAAAAALGFTAFSVTMTAGRLVGDRLVQALGPVRLVRAGGLAAAAGFATALLAADPVVGIAGFACLGAGMSTVVPIVFRAAGAVPGVAPGLGLAAVSSMGYLGFLVGPPLIGGVAELTSLPRALIVLVGLGVAVVALAPVTRPRAGAQPRMAARTHAMKTA
jgi:MFS family permease